MVEDFVNTLQSEFEKNANSVNALTQKKYMRNQFEYYGLVTTTRRKVQEPFLIKSFLPTKENAFEIIEILWQKPEREFQHFAQELAFKYIKTLEEKDIELFEMMVITKSWWDTVDFIANKLMGAYFKKFPELREQYVKKWIESDNIWLQRSALLFQLKYKEDLDTELLAFTIIQLLGSNEFFINKAIGWILREYSRINPNWVILFVEKQDTLSKLSKKEALRLIETRCK